MMRSAMLCDSSGLQRRGMMLVGHHDSCNALSSIQVRNYSRKKGRVQKSGLHRASAGIAKGGCLVSSRWTPCRAAWLGQEEADIEASSNQEMEESQFSWTKQWYPVGVVDLLDPSKPNCMKLLGHDLVIWKDGQGVWRCFEDVCPHRGVPLSEGKIWEDGTLMCSYHGWRFRGEDGAACEIPQAASKEAKDDICKNCRSKANAYLTKEAQNLLWVWGDSSSPTALEDSEKAALPICPRIQKAEEEGRAITYLMRPFFRDLPYDAITLVENVADPAHVPFSHHGVQGNRASVKYGMYELARMQVEDQLGKEKAMAVTAMPRGHDVNGTFYQPPGVLKYFGYDNKGDGFTSFMIFAVPMSPGYCRVITYMATTMTLRPIVKLFLKMPLFLDHILIRLRVLDGDNVFLHRQEQYVRDQLEKGKSWKDVYYLPTKADLLVATCRKWFDKVGSPFGDGKPGYGGYGTTRPPLIQDHRVLLDRYDQHTKNCLKCSKALKWLNRLHWSSGAMALIGWSTLILLGLIRFTPVFGQHSVVASTVPPKLMAFAGLWASGFSLLVYKVSQLIQGFYYVPYVHNDR